MTERFYYDFEDPNGHKIIDKKTGKYFRLETIGDYRLLTDFMNVLSDENEHIKNTIKEAYENERTHIGRNVLKQLLEAIQ